MRQYAHHLFYGMELIDLVGLEQLANDSDVARWVTLRSMAVRLVGNPERVECECVQYSGENLAVASSRPNPAIRWQRL